MGDDGSLDATDGGPDPRIQFHGKSSLSASHGRLRRPGQLVDRTVLRCSIQDERKILTKEIGL